MRMTPLARAVVLILAVPLVAGAQGAATGRITGTVTSDVGQPVYRAQVSIPGTQLGAVTDSAGRYRIGNVPVGTVTLRAASLGYSPKTASVVVTANTAVTADFQLQTLAVALQGMVVVGYGSQRRDEITTSIASVSSKDFNQGPTKDAASLIAGKVPGLGITNPSGDPRSGSQIVLRGVTTVSGNASPLILVDGIPGSLETVAAPDIESISVLKDGSAAAIYGSRASNGVILITTKRHDGGKPTLRYDGFVSQDRIYKRPDFLNADDYRRLKSQGYAFEDLGFNTDWQAAILRQPVSQRHNLSIGGGSQQTNYTGSFTFDRGEGVMIRSDNQEVTGRGNIRHSMFDNKLSADLSFLNRTQDYFTGPSYEGAWRQALIHNPTDRIQTETGAWQERGTYMYTNPVGLIDENNGKYEGRDTRLYGTITLRPWTPLRFALTGGTSRRSSLSGSATTFRHANTTQSGQNGTANRSTSSNVDRTFEGTGTYANEFGQHSVTLLGGYSYQDFIGENFNVGTFNFPTDLFGYDAISRGQALTEGKATLGSGKSGYKVIGFFSRLNYDWKNRYLFTGSLRQEGNSKFGADYKWGLFPGISAAWRLSEEGFMHRFGFINDLKLRAGYGVTGIAPDNPYQSLTSYTYGSGTTNRFLYNGQWIQGLTPGRNPNPNLRWEEKRELNTGVDFALFASRLSGSLDVYRRDTHDMLYNYSVPVPPYLFNSILANVGTMRNNGVELQVNYDVLRGKNLRWTTTANWSRNSNLLKSLSNETFQPQSDCVTLGGTGEPIQVSTHRMCVGQPIGNFYGWKSVDIDTAGVWVVLNKDNKPISVKQATPNDRQILGNGLPKQFAGWNNSFRYRSFDLDVTMRGAFQFQVLNFQRMFYENPKIVQYNMLRSAFDPVYGKRPVNYDLAFVSYYIENGDYWKVDNATFGYTIPNRLMNRLAGNGNVSNARVYLSGRNLLTLTGYKGMDPEVSTDGLTPGNDNRDTYPTTRSFAVGMTISF